MMLLTPGFDTRSHFAAMSEFVDAGWVENPHFRHINPHPDTHTTFRDLVSV